MIGLFAGLAATGLLLAHLGSIALYLYRLNQRPTTGCIGMPPITLLRPVCGVDRFDAETLASSFLLTYPNYEILFCAARADDPAVALVQQMIADNPQVPARLMIGDTGHSANPKLDNVWKGWTAASNDWICMADANLLLPPGYLTALVHAWQFDTGLVSSPAIGTRPEGVGGHLEAAFLNSNQARLQFAADSLGQGFAQGKTLLFHRPLLQRAGGLTALDLHLAEDASATRAIHSLGRKVSLPPRPFEQPVGRKSLLQVWKRQLRWSLLRHDAFPGLFLFEIANGAALPSLMAVTALLSFGFGFAPLLVWLALWYGAEVLLITRAGWPCRWQDFAALPLRDAMIPVIWTATFRTKSFEWRGTAMSPTSAEQAA